MPPKKGTTKAKAQDLVEMKKQSKGLPPISSTSPQPIKSRYLGMYNEFFCHTDQPGFFNADQAYRRKIGAGRKHRINRYHLRIERNTEWEDKPIVFKHLKQFKRLQKISFYMGRKVINSGNKLPQQTEILQGVRKILLRLPHLSSVELIYPYKFEEVRSLRQLGHLNHITFGMNIGDVLKAEKEKGLIQLLTRDFMYHRVNSARLVCYGAPGAAKKGKKAPKGKQKDLKPSEYLSPEFNHFTQLQKLSLDFRDTKTFTAFKPLLAEGTFSQLKRLSIQLPDNGFSIEHKSEIIRDPALALMELLLGKPSKKILARKGPKPDITVRGYENILKNYADGVSALGRVLSVAIKISKSQENEFAEMFSHLKDLKALCLTYSPIADWQVSEVFQGISNLHGLTDLELYLKNYKFSKDSIQGIHGSILQHSSTLTKLCMGFQDVDHINDTTAIMNSVLQLPNLTIFKLYLGYVGSYKKSLRPLRDLTQVKRLTELEVGGFFNMQGVDDVGMEFAEILKNLKSLRWLGIKPVWHYNMWDGGGTKEDFTAILNELQMLRRLKALFVDFDNSTWLLTRPKS